MSVGSTVFTTGNVNPIILPVAGSQYQLIEIGITFQPVEPLARGLKIGMSLVVIPSSVGDLW